MNLTYELPSNDNNEANWNPATGQHFIEYVPQDEIPQVVTILLITVGIIGNCLVCLAILLDRKLQTLTNYFLLSLAITDLLVNILILPSRLIVVRHKFQPSSFPLCYLYLIGDDLITAASAIHICFISVERYLTIKYPLHRENVTKRGIVFRISFVWLIACLTVIPYIISAIVSEHPNGPAYCPNLLADFYYFDVIVLLEAVVIIAMIIIVVVSFIMSIYTLRKLARNQMENELPDDAGLVRKFSLNTSEENFQNKKPFETSQQNYKITWLVSFAFITCMVPYILFSLSYYFSPNLIIPPILLQIAAYLLYANSVINPFIYTLFNKDFRTDFKNLLQFKYERL